MNIKGQYDKLTKKQKYILKHFAYIGRTMGNWNNYWKYKYIFLKINENNYKQ